METHIVSFDNILVTGGTGGGSALRRVGDQTHMSQFFILVLTIATVTDNTTYLTMGTLQELGILDKDLFPYLQRR